MADQFVEIILPVHNATEYVRRCVSMLYEHTTNFRVIFVDDYSDETTRDFLYGPEALGRLSGNLYVRTVSQRWFTRAVNLGLRLVRNEWAVVLNSDTELGPGWLEELFAVWKEAEATLGERVGLVGDTHNDAEGRRWLSTKEPAYVTGHAWLLNMKALQDVANARNTPGLYLDETQQRTIHIFSDNELCYSLNRLGYATIVAHKAAVGHHGGKSWGHNLNQVFGLRVTNPHTGEVG